MKASLILIIIGSVLIVCSLIFAVTFGVLAAEGGSIKSSNPTLYFAIEASVSLALGIAGMARFVIGLLKKYSAKKLAADTKVKS